MTIAKHCIVDCEPGERNGRERDEEVYKHVHAFEDWTTCEKSARMEDDGHQTLPFGGIAT